MKLSFSTLPFLVFAAVGAADVKANLRSSAPKKEVANQETINDIATQVIVHNAIPGTGEDYTPVLSKCFVDSYNLHDMNGFHMESFSPDREVDVPEEGDAEADMLGKKKYKSKVSHYFWGHSASKGCNLCPPDDDSMLSSSPLDFLQGLDSPSAAALHAQFEVDLCACLKKSGLKTYKHAKDCDVEYMYNPTPPAVEAVMVAANEPANEAANEPANEAANLNNSNKLSEIGTQVIVHGSVHSTGEDYASVLSKCFVDSYNKHDMLGYEMASLTTNREIDVPEGDNTDVLGGKKKSFHTIYIFGRADYWGCNLCPPDDDFMLGSSPMEFLTSLDDPSAAGLHALFEEDLCGCLQDSGLKTYKHANKCDVEYMFKNIDTETPTMAALKEA